MPVQYGGGGASASHFVQQVTVASAQWTVIHDLGFMPNVTVLDHNGEEVGDAVQYIDINTVVVNWPSPMTGTVICS